MGRPLNFNHPLLPSLKRYETHLDREFEWTLDSQAELPKEIVPIAKKFAKHGYEIYKPKLYADAIEMYVVSDSNVFSAVPPTNRRGGGVEKLTGVVTLNGSNHGKDYHYFGVATPVDGLPLIIQGEQDISLLKFVGKLYMKKKTE